MLVYTYFVFSRPETNQYWVNCLGSFRGIFELKPDTSTDSYINNPFRPIIFIWTWRGGIGFEGFHCTSLLKLYFQFISTYHLVKYSPKEKLYEATPWRQYLIQRFGDTVYLMYSWREHWTTLSTEVFNFSQVFLNIRKKTLHHFSFLLIK